MWLYFSKGCGDSTSGSERISRNWQELEMLELLAVIVGVAILVVFGYGIRKVLRELP